MGGEARGAGGLANVKYLKIINKTQTKDGIGSADSILAAKNEKYQIKVNFIAEHLFFLTFSTSLLSLI